MIIKFEPPINLGLMGSLEQKNVPCELRIGPKIEILNDLEFINVTGEISGIDGVSLSRYLIVSGGGDCLTWVSAIISVTLKSESEYYIDELQYFNQLEGWVTVYKDRNFIV